MARGARTSAIADGRIVAVADALDDAARADLDATGLHVLPGAVDAHVHFNDPGRTAYEGFETGTRAAAAGGTTTIVDMPLNALPPTIDARAFDRKRAVAERTALVDFALWGGLVPGDVGRLDELAGRGVVGFKAFMSDTTMPEFAMADDLTLYEGMARAATLGLPVAVHAESEAITSALAARARREGRRGVRDYLRSRPAIAEIEAIGRALLLAEETGCALHVVHVSTGRGVALVAEARARGVDATCETCPHYLVFDEDDAERLGAVAKCAPPLRPAAEREALWAAIGDIALVASDHSPSLPELKQGDDFFAIWGGITGCPGAARRPARRRPPRARARARAGRGPRRRRRRPAPPPGREGPDRAGRGRRPRPRGPRRRDRAQRRDAAPPPPPQPVGRPHAARPDRAHARARHHRLRRRARRRTPGRAPRHP